MRQFARLYAELDASTATTDKLAALVRYFASAPAADAAWAVYFLIGGKPRQVVPTALVRATACRLAGIDDWLFEECYQAVGDLAETIAHVLPPGAAVDDQGLAHWVEQRLLPLRALTPQAQAEQLAQAFGQLDASGRFLLVKLIGGGFRVGVSRLLVQRALAQHAGVEARQIAERLMGWTDHRAPAPSAERFAALIDPHRNDAASPGQPYPFFLAHALQHAPETLPQALGETADWIVEWKYDGIRAQLVRRDGQCWIWSRGEELVTERFPEVAAAAAALPDGSVLDGEILAWREGCEAPEPFNRLQQRIARKTLSKKILTEVPVVFVAYDLLEREGVDLRGQPQALRRAALEALQPRLADCGSGPIGGAADAATGEQPPGPRARLRLSPLVSAPDWPGHAAHRERSRARGVEGLMLKHRDARYGSGRTKSEGIWWKWKVDPLSVDAVLIYAQAGHGRRASVYTDYTFAVWSRPPADEAEAQSVVEAIARREPAQPAALQLVPFAKAYSGLTDEEFAQVDRVIRRSTLEKFGPVRSVRPSLVFELGFEGIGPSPRHKSGIAVRFPRMLRLRPDKPLWQADSLETLRALMSAAGAGHP